MKTSWQVDLHIDDCEPGEFTKLIKQSLPDYDEHGVGCGGEDYGWCFENENDAIRQYFLVALVIGDSDLKSKETILTVHQYRILPDEQRPTTSSHRRPLTAQEMQDFLDTLLGDDDADAQIPKNTRRPS